MYEQNLKKTSQAYSFGMKQSDKYNENPGPGTYDAEFEKVRSGSQTVRFTNEKRTLMTVKESEDKPGPGMYEHSETKSKQAYTFGMKQNNKYNENPGPGHYDAEYEKVRSS